MDTNIRMNNGSAILWPSEIDRSKLRKLQNRIIEICERRKLGTDTPISCVQYGAPTANQMRLQLWPDYLPSIRAFLLEFFDNED